MSEDNIALARSLYDAFARGDVATVLGAFDENIEWHEAEGMPYGGVLRGPQAIAENLFGPLNNDIEDFTIHAEEFYAGGDEVVTIGRYAGKGRESGKQLDLPFVHAWTFREGKITRFRQFADAGRFNEALAVEAPA